MQEFIEAMKKVSSALSEMSEKWNQLSDQDNDRVQSLDGWGEAFNVSLDEVPFYMWSMIDELEDEVK
jgi:hypothetical protein